MWSDAAQLLDLHALAVVLLGTAIATAARCGWHDTKSALRALALLGARGFDETANRSALARSASAIRNRGHLCAATPSMPDPASARLLENYLVNGSLEALRNAADSERKLREHARERSLRAFEYAGELAPVFGLVGTLFAITQLSPSAAESSAEVTMAAVATAVLSTLYGVLSAHLIYYPIGRAIERRSEREEIARQNLLDWFEAEISGLHDLKRGHLRDVA